MLLRSFVFLFTISIVNRILVESSAIPYYYDEATDSQAYYAPGVIRSKFSIPEAPTLSPLDVDSLPENLRSVVQGESSSSDSFVEEHSAPEPPPVARTYGMTLEGEHGKVWNDLFTQPGVEFEVGSQNPNEEHSEFGISAEAEEHQGDDHPEEHEESDIFVDTGSQLHDEQVPENINEDEAENAKNAFEINVQNYLIEMLSNWAHSHEDQVKEFLQQSMHPAETEIITNNDNYEQQAEHTEEPLHIDAIGSEDIDSQDDNAESVSMRRHNSHSSDSEPNIKAKNIYGNSVGAEKVTNVFVFLSEHIPEDAAEKLHWLINNGSFSQAYNIDGSNIEHVSSAAHDGTPELPKPTEDLNSEELCVEPLPMPELPTEDFTGQDLSTTETNEEFEERPDENLPVELPFEEQPSEEIHPEEPLVEESPEDGIPTAELPTENLPTDETPAEVLSVDDLPIEELPVEQIPAEELPSEDLPSEEFPAEEFSAQPPVDELPIEELPAEDVPAEELPAEELPFEERPAEEGPAEELPAEELPTEELPAEELPAEESPVDELPATVEEYPTGESQVDELPIDELPVEEPPKDELPADESPVEELPTDGSLADESPIDELPAGQLPAEESSDDITLDVRKETEEAGENSQPAIENDQEILSPSSVSEDAVKESLAEEMPIEESLSGDLPEEEIVEESVLSDEPYVAETVSADID